MKRKNFILGSSLATSSSFLSAASTSQNSIIDTHTHFYDTSRPQGAPWPNKKDPLYRPIFPDEFKKITQPLGVTGTVVVEASSWIEDNQWLLDLAMQDKSIVAVVGNVDPSLDNFKQQIRRFAKHPLFKGIRVKKSLYQLHDTKILKNYEMLADLNLSVDINGGVKALEAGLQLNKKVPSLRLVINHLPFYNFKDGDQNKYLPLIKAAGDRELIFAKVSWFMKEVQGQVMTDPNFYQDILDQQWNAWGSDKVIYGSNWPVSNRIATYKQLFYVVNEYLKTRSSQDRHAYFYQNAQKAYLF